MYKCYTGMNSNQMGTSGESKEEVLRRAQQDPQVQSILSDPAMQLILQQMQQDPGAAQEHMRNPGIAAKIRVLINAGIIQTR
jgi:stress-induced-phosphoprotein 1